MQNALVNVSNGRLEPELVLCLGAGVGVGVGVGAGVGVRVKAAAPPDKGLS